MGDGNEALVAKLRATMNLPADTPPGKVMAAFESDAIRRAGAVGLSWDATLPQIQAAEKTVAVAAAARKAAAAQMVGHSVPVAASAPVEEWHPALVPIATTRARGNSSKSIDWTAALAGDDE